MKYPAVFVVLGVASPASAEPVPARSGYTMTTSIVSEGRVMVQAGSSVSTAHGTEKYAFGETNLIARIVEGLDVNVRVGSYIHKEGDPARTGLEDPAIGLKLRLLSPKDHVVGVSLYARTTLPAGSDAMTSDAWQPTLRLVVGHKRPSSLALYLNAAITASVADAMDTTSMFEGSLWCGHALTRRVSGYVEDYSIVPLGASAAKSVSIVHAGITARITANLQLDVHGGRAVAGTGPDALVGAGVVERW